MSSPPSNKKRAFCLGRGNKPIQVQYLIRSLKRDSATRVKGYILQSESTLPITLMGLGEDVDSKADSTLPRRLHHPPRLNWGFSLGFFQLVQQVNFRAPKVE
ncbi:hypothetical protein CDAR_220321 [Caerostris darwini]|uniref:Uncharacterized protein n=1 Tax=Caerostris darwini TaxID=1538125 RepID=A0AAV4UFG2_9ARAC|nr:hypothetical protein CDAR_220321 [Caerostris darwini]